MNEKPSGQDNSEETLQEDVQDYLDLLLTQATEKPEAQPEPEQLRAGEAERDSREVDQQTGQPRVMGRASPLKMIGGATVRPINPQPGPARPVSRPYAEPARPIRLKWPAPETQTAPVAAPPKPEPPPAPVEAKTETPPAPPAVEPKDVPVAPPEPEPHTPGIATSQWLDNGRPAWAQSPFECLLFSVGGLALAVPLVELGTIYPMSEELTPIFGQVDWFMGLLPVKEGTIKTVNTARVVMPERYRESMVEQFAYVISINGIEWGLAVDNVSNAITLDPADVRWRGERSKRPWLAGTVVEHMCALLDVSQLAAMFQQQDRSARH